MLHMNKQYQDAGRRYREVLALAPDHSEALHGLGVLFHQAGNDLKALPLIYKAIQIDPNKPHYYSNIASVLRKEATLFSITSGDDTNTSEVVQVFVGQSPLLLAEQFTEGNEDNYITSDWECDDAADSTITCTVIIRFVFFEGIPTFSQFGRAIMALLLLGIGVIGFRRFS